MENFKEDHSIAFGDNAKLHPHGDPDSVDGWYSKKLSYKEWYTLACAKRAYQEQAESSPMAVIWQLIAALKLPYPAFYVGVLYLVGMDQVAKSYKANDANSGRKCLGKIIAKYSLLILAGLAVTSSLMLMKDAKLVDLSFVSSLTNLLKRK